MFCTHTDMREHRFQLHPPTHTHTHTHNTSTLSGPDTHGFGHQKKIFFSFFFLAELTHRLTDIKKRQSAMGLMKKEDNKKAANKVINQSQ